MFSFLAYKTLRAIITLFFSNFFQSSFSDGKFIPSQFYSFIKGLNFVILCGSFVICSKFKTTTTAYSKQLLSFLLMGFIVVFLILFNQENLYMIHHNSDLFYDIYNTINEHNRNKLTRFHRF